MKRFFSALLAFTMAAILFLAPITTSYAASIEAALMVEMIYLDIIEKFPTTQVITLPITRGRDQIMGTITVNVIDCMILMGSMDDVYSLTFPTGEAFGKVTEELCDILLLDEVKPCEIGFIISLEGEYKYLSNEDIPSFKEMLVIYEGMK